MKQNGRLESNARPKAINKLHLRGICIQSAFRGNWKKHLLSDAKKEIWETVASVWATSSGWYKRWWIIKNVLDSSHVSNDEHNRRAHEDRLILSLSSCCRRRETWTLQIYQHQWRSQDKACSLPLIWDWSFTSSVRAKLTCCAAQSTLD